MGNSLAIGAVVFVAVVAVALWQGFGAGGSGDGGSSGLQAGETPDKGATGGVITCPGGELIDSTLEQSDDDFTVVGTLEDVEGGRFTVNAPAGRMEMVLAPDPDVEGSYALGDALRVGGRFTADGQAEANQVEPACASFVSAVEAPTPPPTEASPAVEPTVQPIFPIEDDNDDDDDDDKDEGPNENGGQGSGNDGLGNGNEGGGNGNDGGGNGNRGRGGDDDVGDDD